MERIKIFCRDESGASATEYGLLVALIGVAIISAVQGMGASLRSTFESVNTTLGS